ncbi:potassium channel family protein [Jeotgalibacillus sp. ET6]|uniref:potassium channel family protein n=1 Tax=Jeotgalibacillus sp. ET6 TaxID=3037260 RepID=UPI002418172F|nr:potassium channel family protein [Jeotgalibacillus sp. ET6]MDG5472219.1 potassium channel family protein [Jeotgalibacillus sp. ET6]
MENIGKRLVLRMASSILITITIVYLLITLYYFFTNKSFKDSYFSPVLFYKLFFVLLSLTLGFGLLYYLLSFNEQLLSINDPNGDPVEKTFGNFLYFSGVTILSVGYGDMVPVGPARFFALIEASLGLLLPTAYFMKALNSSKDKEEKE